MVLAPRAAPAGLRACLDAFSFVGDSPPPRPEEQDCRQHLALTHTSKILNTLLEGWLNREPPPVLPPVGVPPEL